MSITYTKPRHAATSPLRYCRISAATDNPSGLEPLPVIEVFGVFRISAIASRRVGMTMMDEFLLEDTKEALHRRIIVTVPASAHRGLQPKALHQTLVLMTAILAATVRVMQQPFPGPPGRERPGSQDSSGRFLLSLSPMA